MVKRGTNTNHGGIRDKYLVRDNIKPETWKGEAIPQVILCDKLRELTGGISKYALWSARVLSRYFQILGWFV